MDYLAIKKQNLSKAEVALSSLTKSLPRKEVILNDRPVCLNRGGLDTVYSNYQYFGLLKTHFKKGNKIMGDLPKKDRDTYGISKKTTKMVKPDGPKSRPIEVAKKHVVEVNSPMCTINIPAYTKKYTVFHGWGVLELPLLNSTGHKVFKANLTLLDQLRAGQAKWTKVRNDLARYESPEQVLEEWKTGKATLTEATKALERMAELDPNGEARATLDKINSLILNALGSK